jgi:transglutaminase-like putative cysteine protease
MSGKMRYKIFHQTIYTYNQAVILQPHLLRLRPRSYGGQILQNYCLEVSPEPLGVAEIFDLDGNATTQIWFGEPTEKLSITVRSEVGTFGANPFRYLPETWATQLPINYPNFLLQQLQPYLNSYGAAADALVIQLAQEILQEVEGNTLAFLARLNQRIYTECLYSSREHGHAWPGGVTWREKQGSCRDFAVLYMDVCRVMGLAARFVSGYQEGDIQQTARDLHAWVEVYVPGGGWRGYDPTHGLAVSDRHIALAANVYPTYCAPIVGNIIPIPTASTPAGATMTSNLTLEYLTREEGEL